MPDRGHIHFSPHHLIDCLTPPSKIVDPPLGYMPYCLLYSYTGQRALTPNMNRALIFGCTKYFIANYTQYYQGIVSAPPVLTMFLH